MALENTLQLELIFCFFFLSNQLFYQLKMLRGPLFSNNTFNFIFLFPASSINAPETTLVWVQAWNLKKKKRGRAILFLHLLFLLFSRISLGRTVNNHNMLQCHFPLWFKFHARISKDAQIELFVLSSLTTFPRNLLLLVGIKQRLHFYRRWRRGFYQSCHSRGFILHPDLLSTHSDGGACSCSLGLPSSISHRRLSNALFVFYSLTSFPCHSLA